jgi:hypothetical protein
MTGGFFTSGLSVLGVADNLYMLRQLRRTEMAYMPADIHALSGILTSHWKMS